MSEEELPGMLALAEGVASQRWPHTIDARIWVDEWLRTIAEHPEIPTDRGTMVGWFANAIMAGYDTASLRKKT
jgi:hypothetical protein